MGGGDATAPLAAEEELREAVELSDPFLLHRLYPEAEHAREAAAAEGLLRRWAEEALDVLEAGESPDPGQVPLPRRRDPRDFLERAVRGVVPEAARGHQLQVLRFLEATGALALAFGLDLDQAFQERAGALEAAPGHRFPVGPATWRPATWPRGSQRSGGEGSPPAASPPHGASAPEEATRGAARAPARRATSPGSPSPPAGVAVKIPPPQLGMSEHFRARFLREAGALASLSHPDVVAVHDVPRVPAGELPVMIMEFLDGEDLYTGLRRDGPAPFGVALGWVEQAAAGLEHAHGKGILHRDVKPANLLRVGEQVKVLDFGLAAMDDGAGLTQSGVMLGSLPYMAPEQVEGQRVDEAADVFGLAVTAFELLTGRLPFHAEERAKQGPAARASALRPALPKALDEVFEEALAAEPGRRPVSPLALARRLLEAAV